MATKAKVDNEPRRWFIRSCRPSYFMSKDGKVQYWATIESKIMDAPEPTWMLHKFLFTAAPKTGPGILRRVIKSGDMTACQVFERVCQEVKAI